MCKRPSLLKEKSFFHSFPKQGHLCLHRLDLGIGFVACAWAKVSVLLFVFCPNEGLIILLFLFFCLACMWSTALKILLCCYHQCRWRFGWILDTFLRILWEQFQFCILQIRRSVILHLSGWEIRKKQKCVRAPFLEVTWLSYISFNETYYLSSCLSSLRSQGSFSGIT